MNHFQKELNAQQFNTWIRPLQIDPGFNDDHDVVLIAPNRFVSQWVKDNFIAHIETMAQGYFAQKIQFHIKLAEQTEANNPPPALIIPQLQEPLEVEPVLVQSAAKKNPIRLNPNFTFDNFVTGKANQLARAGAIQVAESPGTAYNALFIYGGVGLGKTHLVQAKGLDVLGCPTVIGTLKDPSLRPPRLARIMEWAASGQLVPHVSHVFPLGDFKAAMRAKWTGEVVGGCVLHP